MVSELLVHGGVHADTAHGRDFSFAVDKEPEEVDQNQGGL